MELIATVEPGSNPKLLQEADIIRLNLGKHPLRLWPEQFLSHKKVMYDVGKKLRILVPKSENLNIGARNELKIVLEPRINVICLNRQIGTKELILGGLVVIRDGLILGEVTALEKCAATIKMLYKKNDQTPLHNAGVNFQGASYKRFWLSENDYKVIEEARERQIFMTALSNVEKIEDISFITGFNLPRVVFKIETEIGVRNLRELITFGKKLNLSVAIMIAQGDLFNEVGPIRFPSFWERIITTCRATYTPVMVATGLLESMKYGPLPTRAEVLALRNFINTGVDYLMLSDETVPDAFDSLGTLKFLKKFLKEYEEEEKDGKTILPNGLAGSW